MQIIPTILEKNFDSAENKIRHIVGLSRWAQIDMVDSIFAEGKTFELELLNNLEETENILWEIHLMVKEPENWINKCNFVMAARVIGQVEQMSNPDSFVNKLKDLGMEAGLAFELETEIKEIPEETDVVLLLSRRPGFGNYILEEAVFKKIDELKKIREKNNLKFLIGVDGGINEQNINKLKKHGVDIAYCGGAIFNGMVKDNLENLKYASEN